MQIIIVGAGIGGLSVALCLGLAGHSVTLLESASHLAEVGAGVQLTPSATKWFWRWGLGPDILAAAVLPSAFSIRSPQDAEVIGEVHFNDFEEKYGGPYLVIHRADIHTILHEHAVKAGTKVQLNSRVAKYDFEGGSVTLTDGTEMHADLVIAVDGINSKARQQFVDAVEDDTGLEPTGYAAFRMMADVSKVRSNPMTASFVSAQNCNCIAGDRTSIMTYMVKGDRKLNLVLSHLDDVDTTGWSQEYFRSEIKQLFAGYGKSPKALIDTAMLDTSHPIANWPVYQTKPLRKWASDSGKFVMMGDAAHAMCYFLSLGVSMAVEDAAALAECLSLRDDSDRAISLLQAMRVFEAVRIKRAGIVKEASLHAGNVLHLGAGPERDIRDDGLRTRGSSVPYDGEYDDQGRHFSTTRMSYGIVDDKIRDCFYGYDLVKNIQDKWAKIKLEPEQ